jgi:hypothetical protein
MSIEGIEVEGVFMSVISISIYGPLIDCYLDIILSASVLSIIMLLLYIPIEAAVIVLTK